MNKKQNTIIKKKEAANTDPVFDAYAAYYDLLYKDKDYAGEAEYVHQLIQRHRPGAKSILELGSGTGRHARLLAEKGYSVHGVERSPEMLKRAHEEAHRNELDSVVSFSQGDIRTATVDEKFDIVISLFHVISYLPTNDDVRAAFANAKKNMAEGGIFIFDVWYGPAVAENPPSVRVKRMSDDQTRVIRICEPKWKPNENRVDVHYQLFIVKKGSGLTEGHEETHVMRYFYLPELQLFLEGIGLRLLDAEAWMTGEVPSRKTWGVCIIAG